LELTPFSRVAIDGPYDDPVEADRVAKGLALELATYVAMFDDKNSPGVSSDWVLGGYEPGGDVTIEQAILRVPTPYRIDPDKPMSAQNRKKVNIVEMCNKDFASKALGIKPIDGTTTIANGYIHAPALPCEVAIYADEDNYVRIEMLNPEAIFTLFFTDVLFGPQIKYADFADAIKQLPSQVNAEIRTIIGRALPGVILLDPPLPLGPVYYSLDEVKQAVASTPYQSPYVHFVYEKSNRADFSAEDVAGIAAAIIETLSLDGLHARSLDAQLNMDDWRSARPNPLPVPGNLVIEACSPTNAITAMGLGLEHATALPCEIAIKALNRDGVDGNETLMVTYLDPHFMFTALFSDAFDDLTEQELADFSVLPTLVLEDLQTVVKAALQRKDIGLTLRRRGQPRQVFFDMLPMLP
jgi:uncharacterized protein (DUF302 family)